MERLGGVSYTRAMHGFSDFNALHRLMDIPMEGGIYTWSNTSSTSRIDRFLVFPILADQSLFPPKKGYLEYYQIIFQFYWKGGVNGDGEFLFGLKICG